MLAHVQGRTGCEIVFIGLRLKQPAIEAFMDSAICTVADRSTVQPDALRPLPHTAASLTSKVVARKKKEEEGEGERKRNEKKRKGNTNKNGGEGVGLNDEEEEE